MRLAVGLLGFAACVAGCGSGAPASSTTSRDSPAGSASGHAICGPASATTLAKSTSARVYVAAGVVYGCASPGSRKYELGARTSCLRSPRVSPVAVAGEIAAYGLVRCGVDTGRASVVVMSLRDGRRLRILPATRAPLGVESFQLVATVAVSGDGAVAWIGIGSSVVGHRRVVEVDKADRVGVATLDSGSGIAPRSLALGGSRVTWRHSGRLRETVLR